MCKVNMSHACEECANKCRLIHKKKRDPSSIFSSCVKVMISDEFFDFLPLPPKFARTVASLVDQEKQVEDSSGRRCTLTLSNVNGRLGFGKGWRSFSSDHGIVIGDILIIHWILGSHFVVQIYGRSGCEKLLLPSRNITLPNKRSRAKPNSASRENGSALDKNKELSEEPCLMMVNRDTPTTGEKERIMLHGDVFSSETSKTKPVGELDCVKNGTGCSNADTTENHIACENAVDDEMDNSDGKMKYKPEIESGTMLMSTSYHSKTMHSETAKDVEIPEQLHNGFAQGEEDNMLDLDATFEGIMENPLDVKLGDIIEDVNYSCWKSEIDQKSNIVKKKENGVSTMNCVELQSARVEDNSVPLPVKTDVHFSTPNIIKQNIHEMHTPAQSKAQLTTSDRQIDGNKGKSILKEQASAVGGSQSTSVCYTPHKGTPGLSEKVIKTEPKEFNLAQFEPTASEDLKLVKDEPVDRVSLEGVQATYLVTPNSESFFETRKRLPMPSRSEVNGKVVVLRDTSGRRWPVLYHNSYGIKGFGSGWGSFFKANGIRCGDECAFTLEDQSEPLYGVQVTKKNPVCGDA